MLKVRITSEEAERGLEVLARSLSRVMEAGARGYMRIQVYPHPDPIIAGMVLLKAATSLGVKAVVTPTVHPLPSREPGVLLGFPGINMKSWEVEDQVVAVSSGQLKGNPPPGAVYVEVEGSVSSALGLALLEHKVPPAEVLPLVSASYSTRYVDPAGRFHGVDKLFLSRLAEPARLEMYTGVKAYNPHRWPAWRSLASTCNPYMPGYTGDPEASRALVAGVGLDPERPLSTVQVQDMEKLASTLLESVGRYARVEAVKLLGGIVVTGAGVLGDLRMSLDVMRYTVETRGLGGLAGLIVDLEHEYPVGEALLEDYCSAFRGLADKSVVRVKIAPWLKSYKVVLGAGDSPSLVWRALELLGRVEKDSLIVYDHGDGLAASVLQAEEALGLGAARRLVESRVAVLEGARLVFRGEEDEV